MDVDGFLREIKTRVTAALEDAGPSKHNRWIVTADPTGVVIAEFVEGMPAHEVMASLVDSGADAAAYATYFAEGSGGPERVYAQVLVAHPRNSATHIARVIRTPGSPPELGPWEPTV